MNSNPDAIDATTRFLGGGGDAGARLRSFDWSSSTLGSPVGWPQALRTMVSVMLASTQPMFLAWGSEGVYLYNDAYAPLIGAKHPSAFGRRFLDMWSEARSQLEPLVDAVFVGEPVIMDDIALALERDGRTEEAHYSFSYTPIRDEAGEVAGLFGVCLETTDRIQSQRREAEAKKALEASERQLQEANASLQRHKAQLESEVAQRTSALISANAALNQAVVFNRTVTDMIPARISYCDADLICRFANGPFSEWLGKQPGEVEGQAVTSLFPAEALAEVRRYLDGALQGIPQRFEGHSRRPDGSIAFSQVDFIPEAPTDASQRPGIFALAIDITKLKKAEQALLALNADLANSRDQARDASRAKSAFLANMSHEIRTPLNAILGMTHIMTRHISDAAQIDRLGKVRTAAQHLRSLIDGVLDLSKIEAGKLVLDAAPFKPAAVISEAMSMLRGTADQKGLRFASERVDVPAVLVGDSLRLTQMLINLLSNAVKFTDSGGVTLRCEVAARSEGRCQLRFEIEDSGPASMPRCNRSSSRPSNRPTRRSRVGMAAPASVWR